MIRVRENKLWTAYVVIMAIVAITLITTVLLKTAELVSWRTEVQVFTGVFLNTIVVIHNHYTWRRGC